MNRRATETEAVVSYTDRPVAQIMRLLAAGLPALVLVAAIVNTVVSRFAKNILALEAFCVLAGVVVARYFYQRSRNREARIGVARIVPSGNEFEIALSDYVVMFFSVFLVVVSAFPSVLSLSR